MVIEDFEDFEDDAGSANDTARPHDALFRRVFCQPEHAVAELRCVLPGGIARAVDWSSLRVCPGSFHDANLVGSHADQLYSVRLGGREALLYVLFEHKSWHEPFTPLQVLGYIVRIWQRYRDENPGAKKLPPVIPVVLHHSERGRMSPPGLLHLVDGLQVLGEFPVGVGQRDNDRTEVPIRAENRRERGGSTS